MILRNLRGPAGKKTRQKIVLQTKRRMYYIQLKEHSICSTTLLVAIHIHV